MSAKQPTAFLQRNPNFSIYEDAEGKRNDYMFQSMSKKRRTSRVSFRNNVDRKLFNLTDHLVNNFDAEFSLTVLNRMNLMANGTGK